MDFLLYLVLHLHYLEEDLLVVYFLHQVLRYNLLHLQNLLKVIDLVQNFLHRLLL
jgi:hypothetical protein